MYGLLTAVVKEIKSLRGMFGMGNEPTSQQPVNFEPKSKTDPEVNVPTDSESLPKKEVITLDFSASEDKIVVSDGSDDESESESDGSDGSDDESESDIDDEDSLDIDVSVSEPQEHPSIEDVELVVEEDVADSVDVKPPLEVEEIFCNEPASTESSNVSDDVKDQPVPTIDQLRKMNLNQLKNVASQIGITVDVTKLKKHELISRIQTNLN